MPKSCFNHRIWCLLAIVLLLPACTTSNINLRESNSLLVNKFGVMCNPDGLISFDRRKVTCKGGRGKKAYVSDQTLPAMVQDDLQAAEQLAQRNNSENIKLLIYIHGGLNKITTSLASNVQLKSDITDDAEHWYYPKFLVWPSDGFTNYFEHALNVSGGRYSENVLRGTFGGAATLVGDTLQSVVTIPRSWYLQGVNVKDHFWGVNNARYRDSNNPLLSPVSVSHAWAQARSNYCKAVNATDVKLDEELDTANCPSSSSGNQNKANINWSSYKRDSINPFRNPGLIWDRFGALSRLTVGSLTHSEIGAASWRNMKRRAFNVSSPTLQFDSRIQNRHDCNSDEHRCVSGMQYFDELLTQINNSTDPQRFELTLIGHSMGGFILNSLINTHIDSFVENQILKNVVYMAAASTIEETALTIRTLFHAYDNRKIEFDQWPQVSNLMLNRVAEVSEMMFAGLVPSGSLLVWVDEIYQRPSHPAGRTIGAEVNIYSALPYIEQQLGPYYTNKITFKSFDRTRGSKPALHGEFNDGKFWHPSFWMPNLQ